jgi:hypothetical protein
VTGRSAGTVGTDYGTVAYNAATGAQLWVSRYNGAANGNDSPEDLAISPDSTRLFVTGTSESDTGQFPAPTSAATVAYNTANGTQLWVSRYNGTASAAANAIGVKPDGTQVIVTGTSSGGTNGNDYATVAYNASTGAQAWSALYNGPANSYDSATSIVVSPDAKRVFVTGSSDGVNSDSDFATIAYNLP